MKNINIFELSDPKKLWKQKKNQLSSTSTSWDRWIKFNDVMTWRHDVTASYKCRDVARNFKGRSRWVNLWRIREFILVSNQVLHSKVEGEARIDGANQMIIYEGVVRTREMSGESLTEPLPRKFWRIELGIIHFGTYLRQTFEIKWQHAWFKTMFNCPHSWNNRHWIFDVWKLFNFAEL